ncbi:MULTISPECIES: Flp family type IVb pilin [Methylobacterium]|uniref:Flp family type IVb pilin n=1 Tax=Methylobacterium TaxID=407 RepID=UPI0013E9AA81|nr:Flp family type IVb pilin [Methylobacterium sp. DB0501]NGM32962.1 Flp family type IVb pilin [Methylobacterium sp. DB0501]
MITKLKRFVSDESGATAIEYGLIATLIALAVIVAARTVGTNLALQFTSVAGNLAPPAATK